MTMRHSSAGQVLLLDKSTPTFRSVFHNQLEVAAASFDTAPENTLGIYDLCQNM